MNNKLLFPCKSYARLQKLRYLGHAETEKTNIYSERCFTVINIKKAVDISHVTFEFHILDLYSLKLKCNVI